MRRLILIALIAPLPFISNCNSNVSSGFTVFLSGTWIGQLLAQTDFPSPFSGDVTMNLIQNEDGTLEGTAIISDPETMCWSGGSIEEPAANANLVAGVTGNRVTFIIQDVSGTTVTIDGTATNNTITALYTSSGGACEAHSGTFRVTRSG